jgi:hypothetical protein
MGLGPFVGQRQLSAQVLWWSLGALHKHLLSQQMALGVVRGATSPLLSLSLPPIRLLPTAALSHPGAASRSQVGNTVRCRQHWALRFA